MNTAKRLVDFYVARNAPAASAAVPAAAPAVGRRQKAVASNAPAKRQKAAAAPAPAPAAEPAAPAVGRRQKAVAVAAEETVATAVGRRQKAIAAEEPVAAAEDDEIVGVPSPVQGPKVWLLCG